MVFASMVMGSVLVLSFRQVLMIKLHASRNAMMISIAMLTIGLAWTVGLTL
jgi:hypothetical protein